MSSSKNNMAILIALSLAWGYSTTAQAQTIDGVSSGQISETAPKSITLRPFGSIEKNPFEVGIRGSDKKVNIFMPDMTPTPFFNPVIGKTPDGKPLTLEMKIRRDMTRQMIKDIRAKEAELVREGKMKPRVRRDIWAEKEAEIKAREAKEGPSVTKSFIIPGTTPAQSEAIHAEEAGIQMQAMDNGEVARVYTTGEESGLTVSVVIEPSEKPVMEAAPQPVNLQSAPETNFIRREGESAEDVMRRYFPDAFRDQHSFWKDKAESLLGFFVSSAYADDDRRPTNLERVTEIADRAMEEQRRPKKMEDLMGEERIDQALKNETIQKAKELAAFVIDRKNAVIKPVNPLEADEKFTSLKEIKPDHEKRTVAKNDNPLAKPTLTYIFVSESLGEHTLKKIMERHAGYVNVALVFRGIPPGETNIAKGIKKWQNWSREFDQAPNIILDPSLFTEFGIKAVPSVVVADMAEMTLTDPMNPGKPKEYIAKVEGLHNDEWLRRQIERGERGDMGQQGTIYEILEPDLIETMKARVAAIDWEEKKKEAEKRFWENQKFEVLPAANFAQVRELDPTVMVTSPIRDGNGNVVIEAGTRVNPLEQTAFTQTLLVFDATRTEEIEWVKREIETAKKDNTSTGFMLMVTQLPRPEKGEVDSWKPYQKLTKELNAPIYLLVPEVKDRFALRATPSKVTANMDKKVFLIEEAELARPTVEKTQSKDQ